MTEQEMFINAWTKEFGTTMKILGQMPPEKANFKPQAEKTKTAKDLACVFIGELNIVEDAVKGEVDFKATDRFKPPATYPEVLSSYAEKYRTVSAKVKAMTEKDWNSTMMFPVGPKQMGQVRRGDVLWMLLMDSVPHRGQFSVSLRLVGAKVPSIYGPSGDEPWM
jgi:hypothetical protein